MFFRLFLGAPTATKPSWHTSRGLRRVFSEWSWCCFGYSWAGEKWCSFRIILEKLRVVWWWVPSGCLAKIGGSSNIFIVVSSSDFDGLLVCWFIGEGCFLLACMVCLPQKFIPMLFLGLLGTLRNALDSSWAAKKKLCLKNLNLLGIHGINMDQLGF